jgi:hypothetical protein
MQWADIPWRPTDRVLRQFAALCLLFFGAIAVLQWRHDCPLAAALLAGLALVVAALGLIRPQGLRLVFVSWLVLVFPLGWLVLNVCLALVFYGLFAPLGLVFRFVGRDAMGLRRRSEQESYLQDKPEPTPARYYRTF